MTKHRCAQYPSFSLSALTGSSNIMKKSVQYLEKPHLAPEEHFASKQLLFLNL